MDVISGRAEWFIWARWSTFFKLLTCAFIYISAPVFAAETQTFTYDALGRLVKVETSGGANDGLTTEITMDDAGNRTNYTVTGAPNISQCSPLSAIYSASSNYASFTGLTGTGMCDAVYDNSASVHGTNTGTDEWIQMDLGSVQSISDVIVAPIGSGFGGWTAGNLDGATLERSDDGTTWTAITTISGSTAGSYLTVAVSASARYLRLRKTGYLGIGDFYATGGGGGTANLAISDATAVTEGGTLSFTVTRSGTTTTAVSVDFASANGSATAGSDYTATSGTLNFAANETTKTISVSTTDDSLVESAESMTVTLSNASAGAAITTATGAGTINDNDSGACSSLAATYSASSNYNSYTGLTAADGMCDGAYAASATVHGTHTGTDEWIAMDLGSVQSVGDVTLAPISSSFDGWGTAHLNGATLEHSNDGSSWATVTTVSGAVAGSPLSISLSTTTRYIRLRKTGYLAVGDFYASSPGGTADLAMGDTSVIEGGTLSFPVTRSGNTVSAVSVSYASANGTAVAGSDYTSASGTISFGLGETSKTISVTTTDDATVESSETLSVTLSSPSSGASIITASGTGTINDNDSSSCTALAATYSASSNYNSYTGLTATVGMCDTAYAASATVHGTHTGTDEWIQMDLGSVQSVGNVTVAPIGSSFDGWGAGNLNGAILERSTDGTNWTTVTTVSGTVAGSATTISVSASTRYLRLRVTGYLGVGDLYAEGP